MKINIECQALEVSPTYSLEENGLLSLLKTYNNCGVVDFKTVIGSTDSSRAAAVLKQLVNKNVFKISETNENSSLVINLINIDDNKTQSLVNLSKNKKIQMCFQLNDKKLKSIVERSTDKKSFKYNLVTICFENYTTRKLPICEINSEEQFIELMYLISPLETIISHDKKLTRRDFDNIFDIINSYDVDLALINVAIDHAITSSKYYNLSYEFVRILLDSWNKHKITTVAEALEIIKKQKQSTTSRGSKYVAPEYDQPQLIRGEDADLNIKKLFTEDDNFE